MTHLDDSSIPFMEVQSEDDDDDDVAAAAMATALVVAETAPPRPDRKRATYEHSSEVDRIHIAKKKEIQARRDELDAMEAAENARYEAAKKTRRAQILKRRERDRRNANLLQDRDRQTVREGAVVAYDSEQRLATAPLLELFMDHIDTQCTLQFQYKCSPSEDGGEEYESEDDRVKEYTVHFEGVDRSADFYASCHDGPQRLEVVAECKRDVRNSSCDSMYAQLVFLQRAISAAGAAERPRFFLACYPSKPKTAYFNMHFDAGHHVWWPGRGHADPWIGQLKALLAS
jgi:hypothetical protein